MVPWRKSGSPVRHVATRDQMKTRPTPLLGETPPSRTSATKAATTATRLNSVWTTPSGVRFIDLLLSEARDHLLRAELERLPAAVTIEDALAEEQEDLAERHVAGRLLDHPADRVGVADEERRAVLAEGHGPRIPHPEAVLGPRLGLALRVGEHEIAAPGRLLAARHPAPVLLGHLAIAPPEHLAEVHFARHHD